MKRLAATLLIGATTLSGGCGGIRFGANPTPINIEPPADITNVVKADIYAYDLQSLVGTIALKRADGQIQALERFTEMDKPKTPPAVKDLNQLRFRSLFTKEFQGGSKIAVAAAQAATRGTIEYTVTDKILVTVERYFPDALKIQATKLQGHLKKPGDELVYITHALLRVGSSTALTEISASAEGLAGPAVGYNGKVYAKAEQSREDYFIEIDAVPFADLSQYTPGVALPSLPKDQIQQVTQPALTAPQPATEPGKGSP